MNQIPTIPSTFNESKINPHKVFTTSHPHHPHSKGKIKNFLALVVFVGLTALLVGLGWNVASKRIASQSRTSAGAPPKIAGSQSIQIDQSIELDAINRKGKKLDKPLTFTITTVEKTKQIIVKGRRATAVEGRIFLIVNLYMRNDNEKEAILQTRQLVRLLPDSLAPSIHNDIPVVEVPAIATLPGRVGFAINENAHDLKLQVGTITGEKTIIDLNF